MIDITQKLLSSNSCALIGTYYVYLPLRMILPGSPGKEKGQRGHSSPQATYYKCCVSLYICSLVNQIVGQLYKTE